MQLSTLRLQVCAPLVASSPRKCQQYSPVVPCSSDAAPSPAVGPSSQLHPPFPAMCIFVLDMAPRPQMGSFTPDAPPTSSCASPLEQPHPACSRRSYSPPRPLRHLPAPPSHLTVPLPSPRCAPFPPLPTHLPAPERRPPPTMPRAQAWPGPCSRDAPRGLPPLFPPCLARALPPILPPSLPVTPQTLSHTLSSRARESSGHFPSVLCGRARPTSPLFPPSSHSGDYDSQCPPRDGGGAHCAQVPPLGSAPPPPADACARMPWRELGTAEARPADLSVLPGQRRAGPARGKWDRPRADGRRRAAGAPNAWGPCFAMSGCLQRSGRGDAEAAESAVEREERGLRAAGGCREMSPRGRVAR